MRVFISNDPYIELDEERVWHSRGQWPCKWITCPDLGEPPYVVAYRASIDTEEDDVVRAHVTADERYELFVDGERIGRGSERGDTDNWFYESYDIPLSKGHHIIVARVWSLGDVAPYAQTSLRHGFIFATEGKFISLLGTGVANWEAKKLGGYEFTDPSPAWGTGANLNIHGDSFDWGFELGEGDGWQPVVSLEPGANGFRRNEFPPVHMLKPATLPNMKENTVAVGTARHVEEVTSDETQLIRVSSINNIESECRQWDLMKTGIPLTIPVHTKRRIIIDLENYYCAYPELIISGGKGSRIRILWSESLYEKLDGEGIKGHRDKIEGKLFWGTGDTFRPDGGKKRKFETLWWQAGRYLEVYIETSDEPLAVEQLAIRETHYPLNCESLFECNNKKLENVIPIAIRSLQMCSHETYMDCPYYEQLQYIGDTRLEVLTTYMLTRDDRLPQKALRMFDASRRNSGITCSRYPSRYTQVIPPFSLWWVGMVYDHALWRNDPRRIRELMRGVRAVIDCFTSYMNSDGLVEAPNGWNYMDWVPGWTWGIPPEGEFGVSGIINWQFVLALSMAAELEGYLGELELSVRNRRLASELAARVSAAFWHDNRQLFADDLAKEHFSEHAQCIAVLSGQVDASRKERIAQALTTDTDLARTTIYFSHYLFETYKSLGMIDALFDRLQLWSELEKNGFKTTFEAPEPSRSDCHAWGAHPLYHYFASILGIRPGSMGFKTVKIEPQLGPLKKASGRLVHPSGDIEVDFSMDGDLLQGSISLPRGITGTLEHMGQVQELAPGKQDLLFLVTEER